MHIPDYHIQNVLKAYCRQLRRIKEAKHARKPNGNPFYDRIDIRAREKREAFIRKISGTVIERILHDPDIDGIMSDHSTGPAQASGTTGGNDPEPGRTAAPRKEAGAGFTYNRIDESNQKTSRVLPLEDLGGRLKKPAS